MTEPARPRLWKPADLVLAVCILALAGALWVFWPSASGDTVVVRVDGGVYGVYSLWETRSVTLALDDGRHNVVEIGDGSVRMREANCPDHLCLRQDITRGGTIVCLPNRVTVELSGTDTDGLDAIAS